MQYRVLVRSLFAAGLIAVAAPVPASASASALCAGVSALGAIADALRLNHIDPLLLPPPNGAEPLAAAAAPPDATALADQASIQRLTRTTTTPSGDMRTALIGPRQRPILEEPGSQTISAKPPATIASASLGYRRFIEDVIAISKLRLDQPANLKRAIQLIKNHDQLLLARGWLAQCSEIAAKTGEFISGLDQAAGRDGGPDSLKSALANKPAEVLDIGGWDSATHAVMQNVAGDTALMERVAFRLTEIAYGRTDKEAGFAEEAKRGAPPAPTVPSAREVARSNGFTRSKPLVTQILALGARLHLENAATLAGDPAAATLASNRDNDQCLRWAQLNFNQCLSAARDNQERAFCLAEHGLKERSKCWSVIYGAG